MMQITTQTFANQTSYFDARRQQAGLASLPSSLRRVGFTCLVAWACASCAAAPAYSPDVVDSAALLFQIRAEIGDPVCDAPQQCSSIAVGAKACGGPEGHLAWSSKVGNSNKLANLVAQHALARKAEQERNGMVSDCMVVVNPGATCVAGRCTLLSRMGARGERAD
jgi:hypothetical protein